MCVLYGLFVCVYCAVCLLGIEWRVCVTHLGVCVTCACDCVCCSCQLNQHLKDSLCQQLLQLDQVSILAPSPPSGGGGGEGDMEQQVDILPALGQVTGGEGGGEGRGTWSSK